jgi:hypothetical protein
MSVTGRLSTGRFIGKMALSTQNGIKRAKTSTKKRRGDLLDDIRAFIACCLLEG